jgi:hypothetical protein
MHFDALNPQALFFEEGEEMQCSAEEAAGCSLETLRVTTCTLCACPFPLHDIDVFSCCHLYNPWCNERFHKKSH